MLHLSKKKSGFYFSTISRSGNVFEFLLYNLKLFKR